MKKLFSFFTLACFTQTAMAGGILTNTSQSAQYVRMLSRGASTQIDAVYFNPAGLMKLENGFYAAIHNQSIFQTKTITTGASLNNKEFKGDITTFALPSAFAVYKTNYLAFSLGFGPNCGNGTAKYNKGLPSFEKNIAALVPQMAGLSSFGYVVSGYAADIQFNEESVFRGLQFGVSAKVNEVISGYLGVRYLPSLNKYTGSIKNVSFKVNGQMLPAGSFMTQAASTISSRATQLNGSATKMQQLISSGAGNYTIAQVQNAGYISSAERAALEGALSQLGLNTAQIAAMNITSVKTTFSNTVTTLNTYAAALGTGTSLVADTEVDTRQTGNGITPFIAGVNISPGDNLNIGIKYEYKTFLTLKNDTRKSDMDLDFLKNEEEIPRDIPGLLTVGADYKFTDKFSATLTFNNYFDKALDWGKNINGERMTIDHNSWELALGLQYDITENFAVSVGGMQSTIGAGKQFHSDFFYENSGQTGALGFQWKMNDKLVLDAGMLYSIYKDLEKQFTGFTETYAKSNMGFAVGIGYKIF